MKNPFRGETPLDGMEERIEHALTAIAHETPRPEAADGARSQLLSLLHPRRRIWFNERRRKLVATAAAVLAPMALIGAAAALHGSGNGGANLFAAEDTATGTASATMTATGSATDTATDTSSVTPSTTSSTTPTASSTPSASQDAHTNGHGCDDTLFALGNPPFAMAGGPIGCTVGNSGDHRQNGMNGSNASPSPSETPSSTETGTTTETGTPTITITPTPTATPSMSAGVSVNAGPLSVGGPLSLNGNGAVHANANASGLLGGGNGNHANGNDKNP